jgi:antitoxin component YwqK of YwqJK toxin-antitoxin module
MKMEKNEEVKVEYWDNGNKKVETHYKDGKENGLTNYYDHEGEMEGKIPFKNGKEDGIESGWVGNSLVMVVWKDGVKEYTTEWDFDFDGGEVREQTKYKNGEKEMERVWCDEERHYEHLLYKNGEKVLKTVFYGDEEIPNEYTNVVKHFQQLEKEYENSSREVLNYWL